MQLKRLGTCRRSMPPTQITAPTAPLAPQGIPMDVTGAGGEGLLYTSRCRATLYSTCLYTEIPETTFAGSWVTRSHGSSGSMSEGRVVASEGFRVDEAKCATRYSHALTPHKGTARGHECPSTFRKRRRVTSCECEGYIAGPLRTFWKKKGMLLLLHVQSFQVFGIFPGRMLRKPCPRVLTAVQLSDRAGWSVRTRIEV